GAVVPGTRRLGGPCAVGSLSRLGRAAIRQQPRMKILLFGCNGEVGWELQRSLSVLGEVVALPSDSTDLCADFSRPEALTQTVRAVRPDVIVNAAAHT